MPFTVMVIAPHMHDLVMADIATSCEAGPTPCVALVRGRTISPRTSATGTSCSGHS